MVQYCTYKANTVPSKMTVLDLSRFRIQVSSRKQMDGDFLLHLFDKTEPEKQSQILDQDRNKTKT